MQIPQMLTFYHTCFIIYSVSVYLHIFFFFLKNFKGSCRHDSLWLFRSNIKMVLYHTSFYQIFFTLFKAQLKFNFWVNTFTNQEKIAFSYSNSVLLLFLNSAGPTEKLLPSTNRMMLPKSLVEMLSYPHHLKKILN